MRILDVGGESLEVRCERMEVESEIMDGLLSNGDGDFGSLSP